MITRIGIVAGEIWQLLDKNGPTDLSVVKKKLKHPDDIIVMSVGWMAREGHIILEPSREDYKVSLRQQ